MVRLRKILLIGLTGFMLAGFYPLSAWSKKPPYIIYVGHMSDQNASWTVFRNGLLTGMNKLNLHIEMRNPPTGDLDDMEALVTSAINAQPDGLILTVPRKDMAHQWVTRAQERSIPVILVGSSGIGVIENKGNFPLISIGLDEYQAGFSAGRKMKKSNLTHAICLVPRVDVDDYFMRCQGASDAIGNKVPVFSLENIGENLDEFFKLYKNKNPKWQSVLVTEISQLDDIFRSLRSVPDGEAIQIISFGLTRNAAHLIRSKRQVAFAVDAQPFLQGYQAAMIFSNYYHHGMMWGSQHISTGPQIITAKNVGDIISFAGSIR